MQKMASGRQKKGAVYDRGTRKEPVMFTLPSPLLQQQNVPVGLIRLPIEREKGAVQAALLERTLALMRSSAGGAIVAGNAAAAGPFDSTGTGDAFGLSGQESPAVGDGDGGGNFAAACGPMSGPPQPGMLREVLLRRDPSISGGLGMVLKFRKAESGGVRSFVSEVEPMSLAASARGTLVTVDNSEEADEAGDHIAANNQCAGLTPGDEIVAINGRNLMLKSAAEVLQSLDNDVVRIRCVFPLEHEPGIDGADGRRRRQGKRGNDSTSDDCTVS